MRKWRWEREDEKEKVRKSWWKSKGWEWDNERERERYWTKWERDYLGIRDEIKFERDEIDK